ncbi:FISUMP domain-containing protein [Chryseobacterium fistulae]|uniref:Fibrobacter succinogenes major paralogous domain-containing protein n=1 Tax=Chryseobacterium fistulae TaxID=2675058 RepID=A0A6N4Y0P0_9FLAO|nr:FISUMP domain-containing protein [Chryseobacterium fistulae]CAA7392657.1 hypothetical protein CHRY9393_03383 [Chryseobacterium fistulae]
MKKTNLLLCMLVGAFYYSQVGVNTTSPKATLEVTAKNSDGSTPEGIIVPRLTGNQLFAAIATGVYTMDQHGAIVYIYEPTDSDKRTGQTEFIDDFGFYYYDGYQDKWNKMGGVSTIYRTDGTLTGPRHMTMNGNNLGFTGGRIGMGTPSPDPSAILDLASTNDGFLPPRMTKTQMDAILHPATGLVVYCTDCFGNLGCLMVNDSKDTLTSNWGSMCSTNVPTGDLNELQCTGASTVGTLHSGVAASGVSVTIPYTGGNGGTYFSGAYSSTGVMGLTANLQGGSLANGSGNVTLIITGTPSTSGTASFDIMIAGKSCPSITIPVDNFTADVTSLTCGSAVFSPNTLTQAQSYSGTLTVPYVGGNGDSYPQQSFTQNGLTFTLPAGTLATGSGNLVYNIAGTPTNAITMNILISFGSTECNLNKIISPSWSGGGTMMCMNNSTKLWASHNLGADTSLDPNIPVKEIHGNYYQWGRLDVVADTDTPAGAISGWNTTYASNGAWNSGTEDSPVKTAIDPCPAGFRVPTRKEWNAMANNNTSNTIGTFSNNVTNFGAARQYVCPGNGNKLTLPAAGYRNYSNGALNHRGYGGLYWSSTENSTTSAYTLSFGASYSFPRTDAYTIRCISE